MKTCKKCLETKEHSEFYFYKKRQDYVSPCKKCTRKKSKEWMIKNKERMQFLHRQWYEKNKEKVIKKSSERYEKHKDRVDEVRRNLHQTEKYKNKRRNRKSLEIKNLHDNYVKHLITQETCISKKDVPLKLIEVYRLKIQLKRIIKEKKQCQI